MTQSSNASRDPVSVDKRWTKDTSEVEKVNAFCVYRPEIHSSAICYAVGGFDRRGKGVVQVCNAPSGLPDAEVSFETDIQNSKMN
jgi:hypothetical protein